MLRNLSIAVLRQLCSISTRNLASLHRLWVSFFMSLKATNFQLTMLHPAYRLLGKILMKRKFLNPLWQEGMSVHWSCLAILYFDWHIKPSPRDKKEENEASLPADTTQNQQSYLYVQEDHLPKGTTKMWCSHHLYEQEKIEDWKEKWSVVSSISSHMKKGLIYSQ